jgi:D-glycero-D-manno-heptose 1,7-bisphosphate phosphatase
MGATLETTPNLLLADLNGTLIPDQVACSEWEFLPWVAEAVEELGALGWGLAIVTNQPEDLWPDGCSAADVARWVGGVAQVCAELLRGDVSVYVCGHRRDEGCNCRKPKAALLWDAIKTVGVCSEMVWMVGDQWSDVQAGWTVGVKTCAVGRFGYRQQGRTPVPAVGLALPDLWVPDFRAAVRVITSGVLG